jgi:hypothetical protein
MNHSEVLYGYWSGYRVLLRPSAELEVTTVDPARLAVILHAPRIDAPARVPEVVNAPCAFDDLPAGAARLYRAAVAIPGLRVVATYGVGHRLTGAGAYSHAVRIIGSRVRAYGVWVDGKAAGAAWWEPGYAWPARVGVAELGARVAQLRRELAP